MNLLAFAISFQHFMPLRTQVAPLTTSQWNLILTSVSRVTEKLLHKSQIHSHEQNTNYWSGNTFSHLSVVHAVPYGTTQWGRNFLYKNILTGRKFPGLLNKHAPHWWTGWVVCSLRLLSSQVALNEEGAQTFGLIFSASTAGIMNFLLTEDKQRRGP